LYSCERIYTECIVSWDDGCLPSISIYCYMISYRI